MVDSVSMYCGLSFAMMATCAHAICSQYSNQSTATDFASTKSLNEGCVDVSGRQYVCTSSEEGSRLRASASLPVKISLCTRATILKDGETDGKVTCRYVQLSPLALSLFEDSGPSGQEPACCDLPAERLHCMVILPVKHLQAVLK